MAANDSRFVAWHVRRATERENRAADLAANYDKGISQATVMKQNNISPSTRGSAHAYSVIFALLVLGNMIADAGTTTTLSVSHSPPPAGVAPVGPPPGGMAIDGDLFANWPATDTGDWILRTNSPPPGIGGWVLNPGGVPLNAATTFHIIDPYDNMGNDSVFVGGLKWFDDPNTWQSTSGKSSSKTDINNVLLHIASDAAGHVWAVVAADRSSTSGDSYIDFEFLQNPLTRDGSGKFVSSGPNGGRTTNDLLLSLAFTGGGKVADFYVWRWQADGSGGFAYADVTSVLPVGRIFAALNTGTIAVPYTAFGRTTYAANAFAEGAVDLTVLVGTLDPCLSLGVKSIMVKTKASQSGSATIEDFTDPIQYNLTIGPSADAGTDQTRCAEGETTAFALRGTANAGLYPITNVTWSVVGGAATIDAPASLATVAHVDAPWATLRLTVMQANGCVTSDDVVLRVTALPVVSIDDQGLAPCPGQAVQFSAPAGMSTYAWSISGNGVITGGGDKQVVTVTAGAACSAGFMLSLNVTANGCSSSVSREIPVNDTTPPQLTSPPDVTIECSADAGTNATGVASAADACGQASLSWSDAVVMGCGTSRVITRTWTASDPCGNAASANQTITLIDRTPPAISGVGGALTVECDQPVVFSQPTARDNCDSSPRLTYNDVITPGDCPQEKVIVRTWTATDACGNANTASQRITIQDTTLPVISGVGGALTIECDQPVVFSQPTASDNCDSGPRLTNNDVITAGDCPQEKVIVRTWTATDACGNASTASQRITIQDTTLPVISGVGGALTIECDQPVAFSQPTASDNGDPSPRLTYNDAVTPGDCPQEKVIVRTWTATDACGNAKTASQRITIQDTTPPVISGVGGALTIECDQPVVFSQPTASDNCDSSPQLTYNDVLTPGDCPQEKVIVRTWTATDACGNAKTASQRITIQDTTPPVISGVGGALTIECDQPVVFSQPRASDNCDPSPRLTYNDVITPGDCSQEKIIVRTWTATDACGNAKTASQRITIQDTTLPVISGVGGALTIECDQPVVFSQPTASDNCDSSPRLTYNDVITPGDCPQEKLITRTWTARDACGNVNSASQRITIQDTTLPTFRVPADVVLECPADTRPSVTGTATAEDKCGRATVRYSDAVRSLCGGAKVITRTWLAVDECGNSISGVQTITVEDRTPPDVFCSLVCTYSQGGYGGSGTPASILEANYVRAFPNGIMVGLYDPAGGSGIPNGLRWEGTAAGLAAIGEFRSHGGGTSGRITRDALNPIEDFDGGELAHQSLTLTLNIRFNELGVIGVGPNNFGSLIYTRSGDSLSGSTVSQLLAAANRALAGHDLPDGYSYGSLTALIDNLNLSFHEYGRSAWAASYLSTPAMILSCAAEVPVPNPAHVRASDRCGGPVTLAVLPDAITEMSCLNRYVLTRVWVAWDACGNSNSCSYRIEVNDTNPPTVVGPVRRYVPVGDAWDFMEPVTSDNCGAVNLSIVSTTTNITSSTTLVATRTWEVADECGNSVSYTQTVIVVDPAAAVQSTFDWNDEGWRIINGPVTENPTYLSTGGQGSGFVSSDPGDADVGWFWEAPLKFRGNRVTCYNGVLEFALKKALVSSTTGPVEVTLCGAGITLTLQLPQPVGADWTTYKVRLNEQSGWQIKALHRQATQAELAMVLSALANLRICAGAGSNGQSAGLDNVALARPAADGTAAWMLDIIRVGPNLVRVRWPAVADGFALEATDNLASGHWVPVSIAPYTMSGLKIVDLTPSPQQRFFRLRKTQP